MNHHTELFTSEFLSKSMYEQKSIEANYFSERISNYINPENSKKWLIDFLREINEYMQSNIEILSYWLRTNTIPMFSKKDWIKEEWESQSSFARHVWCSQRVVSKAIKKWWKCKWYEVWSDFI